MMRNHEILPRFLVGHAELLFSQMTFQQICKDVHMVKTNGQQVFIESRNRPAPRKNSAGK